MTEPDPARRRLCERYRGVYRSLCPATAAAMRELSALVLADTGGED